MKTSNSLFMQEPTEKLLFIGMFNLLQHSLAPSLTDRFLITIQICMDKGKSRIADEYRVFPHYTVKSNNVYLY